MVMFTEHPIDMEAVPDEWVQFNCTVNCNYTVRWFIAGYPSPIKRNNTVPGLVTRRTFSRCTSSNQTTHFFEVQANKAVDSKSNLWAYMLISYCTAILCVLCN